MSQPEEIVETAVYNSRMLMENDIWTGISDPVAEHDRILRCSRKVSKLYLHFFLVSS